MTRYGKNKVCAEFMAQHIPPENIEIVPPIEERTLPKRDLREHPYRLLVTGSEGFIGKYLVNYLRNDPVYGEFVIDTLDIKNGQDLGDFTRPDIRYDCVIHLAAFADIRNSLDDPDRFWENKNESFSKNSSNVEILFFLPLSMTSPTASRNVFEVRVILLTIRQVLSKSHRITI